MIRLLLRSYIKRFISIFLALIIIGGVSSGLFNAFLSAKDHLLNDPNHYFKEYGYIDEQINIAVDEKDDYMGLYDIEGVASIDMRLSLDVHLEKDDGRTINTRIITYNGNDTEIMKRYIVKQIPRKEDKYNISISYKFAKNNNFNIGDEVNLTLSGLSKKFYINEIVDTVEEIYPTYNAYVRVDDYDFGYIYFLEDDLNKLIEEYAPILKSLMSIDNKLAKNYENIINSTNLSPIDLNNIPDNYASTITNEIIIKNLPGYTEDDVLNKVKQYLDDKGIEPKSIIKGDDTPSRRYMKSVNRQLGVAFIFLPVFFYVICMVLVAMFIGQIIRQTTRNIGIMLSNGISRWNIISVLLAFSSLISIVACIISVPIGYGLSCLISSSMIKTYYIPTIRNSLHIIIVLISILTLLIISIVATLIASIAIFKITPKDAIINNEARRKTLPHALENKLNKTGFVFQSSTNSILQNKRRFFISTISILASLTMILLCGFFHVSKTELINQFGRRMNYDYQIYLTEKVDDEFVDSLKNEECVTEMIDCYYSYLKISNKNGDYEYLECLAFNPLDNDNKMIQMPDERGQKYLTMADDGIILPKKYAQNLNVKKGDYVIINDIEIKIIDISYQYFHPISYLSKNQLINITSNYVSTLLINTDDEIAMSKTINKKTANSLIVSTNSLTKDLHRIYDTLDLFLIIMIVFALFISLIILYVMSQNALLEQIFQLSLYRALGININTISSIYLIQNTISLIFATLFAIPLGILSSSILFDLASSSSLTYPFIFSIPIVCISLLFIIVVILIYHVFTISKIKRLDLATNLRSSE